MLALRKEKEELLDTVWLATSGKQIKDLWQKVSDLLQQEPTPLQQDALAMKEPIARPSYQIQEGLFPHLLATNTTESKDVQHAA